MATITLSACVREKLKSLLVEEDNDEAFVRIREVKAGAGWKSHMELRLSIDERDDLEDEVEADADGIPFIISEEVIDIYGDVFDITMNAENGQPAVRAVNHGEPAATPCCGSK